MKINEIVNILEKIAPKELAEKWDNVGLLVESEKDDIKKILVALDVTNEVIDEAITNNVDLIVTHHPILISGIKKISISDFKGKQLIKLINNEISVYTMHTNFDIVKGGTNDILADKLKLNNIDILNNKDNIGKIGRLDNGVSLESLIEELKGILCIETIKYVGNKNKNIEKVALCTGSGMEFYKDAVEKGADLYITGDIKYHNAVDANESNLAIIDATHYSSENIAMDVLKNLIEKELTVEVIRSIINVDPFKYL